MNKKRTEQINLTVRRALTALSSPRAKRGWSKEIDFLVWELTRELVDKHYTNEPDNWQITDAAATECTKTIIRLIRKHL